MKACPVCGNPVEHTCFHEGMDDVQSVEMSPRRALHLAKEQLEATVSDLESSQRTVTYLEEEITNKLEAALKEILACRKEHDTSIREHLIAERALQEIGEA